MKTIYSLLFVTGLFISVKGFSSQSADLASVLSKYRSYGDGCRIEISEGNFTVHSVAAGEEPLRTKLNPLRSSGGDAYFFEEDRAYLGVSTTYLIPRDGRLSIITTWKDMDGGVDRSLFCDLYEK